jgi:two-component system, sensor histidine kinase PdtaS
MTSLFSLRSVKARLFVLLLLIAIPVFGLPLILATITYRTDLRNIEVGQIKAVDDYAIRTRIWLRGILSSVEVMLRNVPSSQNSPDACRTYIANVLQGSPIYKALYVSGKNRGTCHSSEDGFINDVDLQKLISEIRAKPETERWITSLVSRFRYDTVKLRDIVYVVLYIKNFAEAGDGSEGLLIVSPNQLDQIFDLGTVDQPTVIGLVANETDILAARGSAETDTSWFPRQWPSGEIPRRWSATANSGLSAQYAARMVAEPGIAILAYFDGAAERVALQRYIALCAAPLIILAIIYGFSWRFIQNDIVRGIAGIESAAHAERDGRLGTEVAIDPRMPDDIRKVAESFNRMLEVASSREATLRASVESYQDLMRELHHRVKNSLQVIQSYLALTRREQPDRGGEILRDAEAKVQVLAIAYRFALTEEGMRPVPLEPFIKELLLSMTDAARRTHQTITADIRTDVALSVDRSIPLGLAIVEQTFSCLKKPQCRSVRVLLEKHESGELRLTIADDGFHDDRPKISRTLHGLQIQLGAIALPVQPPTVLCWTLNNV